MLARPREYQLMAPPTLAEFTARFRTLEADQRAAFVADLFAAGGWETERDGRSIVATAGGETRRLSVGRPPPDAEVDAVVTVPSRTAAFLGRLAGQTEASPGRAGLSGARRVGVAHLHERLLYAIDRDRAARLYRIHFDAEFDAGGRREGTNPIGRTVLAALVVVGLVGSAAVVVALSPGTDSTDIGPDVAGADTRTDGARDGQTTGEGGGEADGGGTTDQSGTADPTGTPADDRGIDISLSEVRDPERLIRAHRRAIADRPVEMSARFRGPRFLTGFDTRRAGYDSEDEVTFVVRAQSPTSYYTVRRINFSGSPLTSVNATYERYADGTAVYRRVNVDGSVEYDRGSLSSSRSGHETIDSWSWLLIRRYLNTTDRRVELIRTKPAVRYRIVATGDPRWVEHATRDYRAVATVRTDGLVTSLRVTYVHPGTGAPVRVRLRYDTWSVAVDPVEPPDWYASARRGPRWPSTPTPGSRDE